jgi:hypothetical protein
MAESKDESLNLRPSQEWMEDFYTRCGTINQDEADAVTLYWAACISNKKGERPVLFADGPFRPRPQTGPRVA